MSASVYQLTHAQIAADEATPTFLDVDYVTTLDVSIDSSVEFLSADGSKPTSAYSAPEGSGNLNFGRSDFGVLAVANGGTSSTSGTAGTDEIKRYEQPGTVSNPLFIVSGYGLDTTGSGHGFRVTVPRATAAPASISLGQETWVDWSMALSFTPNDADVMIIYETLEADPTYTNGVYPVNLTAPAAV